MPMMLTSKAHGSTWPRQPIDTRRRVLCTQPSRSTHGGSLTTLLLYRSTGSGGGAGVGGAVPPETPAATCTNPHPLVSRHQHINRAGPADDVSPAVNAAMSQHLLQAALQRARYPSNARRHSASEMQPPQWTNPRHAGLTAEKPPMYLKGICRRPPAHTTLGARWGPRPAGWEANSQMAQQISVVNRGDA